VQIYFCSIIKYQHLKQNNTQENTQNNHNGICGCSNDQGKERARTKTIEEDK
jgi:hypothetical protein